MKYLFFDVECSNCHGGSGKICEFGYVLTDENFKIIFQDEFPINPGRGLECRFDLKDRKHEKDLELAYDYETYYAQPEFPYFYERIRKLMEDPDTICFAWSSHNDMSHIYHTCARYHLKQIEYACYDVQLMADKDLESKKQLALKPAFIKLVGPSKIVTLQEHLSRDDAKMTMMIMEALCVLNKVDSKTLIEQSKNTLDHSLDTEARIFAGRRRRQNGRAWKDAYANDYEKILLDEYKGKQISFSRQFTYSDIDLEDVINKLHSLGYILVQHLDDADIYVMNNMESIEKFKASENFHYDGKIVTIGEIICF